MPAIIARPSASRTGRRLPHCNRIVSLKEAIMGAKKKPRTGENAQIIVMNVWERPIPSRIGVTKAVSAAYRNSIPTITIESRISCNRDFFLLFAPTVLQIQILDLGGTYRRQKAAHAGRINDRCRRSG
uniref:Uncharacterized protein n=1 Tax=Anopheles culicifacies TaxID=139723 RepID=A0A182M8Y7_9DIPT